MATALGWDGGLGRMLVLLYNSFPRWAGVYSRGYTAWFKGLDHTPQRL